MELKNLPFTVEEEKIVFEELMKRAYMTSQDNKEFFMSVIQQYKNFDFSCVKDFDKLEVDKVFAKADADKVLCNRPLLMRMYIYQRNGFNGFDFLKNKSKVFDLVNVDVLSTRRIDLPEGVITEDGRLYGIGKDGHIFLYEYLNLLGVNTNTLVRYSNFRDVETNQKHQYISKLKEFDSSSMKLYLTDEQAIAINNLRRIYEPENSLKKFLLKSTANLGFREGDSLSLLNCNYDTFSNLFPHEYLDKGEIKEEIKSGSIHYRL